MGIWGAGIFSDDIALEIREAFRDHLANGGPAEAFVEEMRSSEQEPAAWLALAATQWQLGRLDDYTKTQALHLIASGAALEGWSGNAQLFKRRERALESLAAKLSTTPPKPRKIHPRFIAECSWLPSNLVAYRLLSGPWIILHVVNIHRDEGGAFPVVRILEGSYTAPPEKLRSANAIRGSVKFSSPDIPPEPIHLLLLGHVSKRHYPEDRLVLLPFSLAVPGEELNYGASGCLWPNLDSCLKNSFPFIAPQIV